MVKTPIRTLSGVAPMAIMIPPRKCPHGVCAYCPSLDAPQSYTPKSPAVLRAKIVNYNPAEQVLYRLKQFKQMGHPTDKIEIIIMGGTFLNFPVDFQFDFIKGCYDALNGKVSASLEEAKKLNESAEHRCVALCIETRPDICSEKEIENMLKFGCTRVELGVQAIDDAIYERVNRGHKVKDVVGATKRLKHFGFKVGYHIMWGLPGSDFEKDVSMFEELFSDERFRPDQLKIYPCQVLKGSGIEKDFFAGNYRPYSKEDVKKLLKRVFPIVPKYCRVMRVMREIPREFLVCGILDMGVRGEVEKEIRDNSEEINEIRFREIGHALRNGEVSNDLKIERVEYSASGGEEIFFEAVNEDGILFGLLRLRLERGEDAMIREIHVYGPVAALGISDEDKYQHKGIGKELLKKAEDFALLQGFGKMKIISGVGVREYYRKLDYGLDEDGYMVKEI